ncbi:isoaspartyl peptidase/L-asparaginase [Candidatus Amarolinea dominans]|uniref:isoaspartyl peptidase/L-asparaginase family protein n=1 Tax=Candidatus Amarolinea dominans TaxID=3140696 RepID=UPI003134684C|nr:isoaspartyl peptidase/L-asparaginase [Anaerolineae bacterium]MBK9230996.1 isoaspartyl peptidase/L-asparaginase [Anaerolineae bacterium]
MPFAIIVHGGAGNIREAQRAPHAAGIRQAVTAGYALLARGESALDAAQAAVMILEDLPAFNAGRGSCLTSAGTIEMDAGLMDGRDLRVGAVASITHVANPIAVARLVMERSEHILFAAEGAQAFAQAQGVAAVSTEALLTPARTQEFAHVQQANFAATLAAEQRGAVADTVGAVALDIHGNLAAACSTGGMSWKKPGRVGDSPLPGCGYYADSQAGGCVTTGWGETIARVVLARRAVEALERGLDPQAAAQAALAFLAARTGGWAGLIVLDRHGRVGAAFNSVRMTHAWWDSDMAEPTVVA